MDDTPVQAIDTMDAGRVGDDGDDGDDNDADAVILPDYLVLRDSTADETQRTVYPATSSHTNLIFTALTQE